MIALSTISIVLKTKLFLYECWLSLKIKYSFFKNEYSKEFQLLKLNLSWLTNQTLTTEIVTVSMTKRCNLNCTYCWDHDTREKLDEMSTSEILKIIDDAKKLGAKVFNVFGGEPFIRKDTVDIIQYALKLGLKVTVTTNGTLLPEDKCEELIKNANFSNLIFLVSLDGCDETENDFIRGQGSFKKTIQTIKTIQNYRLQYETGVGLIINTVVSRNNYMSILKQYELSRSLQVDSLHFITPVISSFEVHKGMEQRKLIIQPDEFPALDQMIDSILLQKNKTPDLILNNYESLNNFKNYYRRQHTLHEKFLNSQKNIAENIILTKAEMS